MQQQVDLSQYLEEVYQRLQPDQVFEGVFNHSWKKAGPKWRGKCPWHDSKSGTAFYVNTRSLTWRCPQCDRGGGPIQYLHQIGGGKGSPKGKQFIELAEILGGMVGLELPERELSDEQKERIQRVENRRSMLECVISFCHRLLVTESKAAIVYLTEERGFTLGDIEALQLGVFPSADRVAKMLTEKGFLMDDAIDCGLLYERRDESGKPIAGAYGSSLSNYIIVPWNDEHGRPLTLYGRWQSKTPPEGRPKTTALKNPGTTEEPWLRSKRSPLYLDRALAAGHRDLVVVEGVFDAAILQVRGETRAIAWVAANPSAEQIQTLVKCKIQSVTFCLDPDGAGDSGTRDGIKHLTKAAISTYAAPLLPDGLDPDEFVNQRGIGAWTDHIEASIHGLRFTAQKILEGCNVTTDKGRDDALKAGKAFCDELPDSAVEAIGSFFWPEFKQRAGLEVQGSTLHSQGLKDAVIQLEKVRDPFERALFESQIKQEFKVGAETLRSLERFLSHPEESQSTSLPDLLQELYGVVEERLQTPGMIGIPSGFHALDGLTGGWQRGDLIILAARPSMGKTAMMLGCAVNAAKQNYSVAVISIESDKKQIGFRMLSAETGINSNSFLRGDVSSRDLESVNSAIVTMAFLPITVFDQGISTFAQIEAVSDRLKASPLGVDLIVIDYLQMVEGSGSANRNYELSDITRKLKAIAKRLNVAIVCLSQLSRSVESRTDKRPMMSDLRDSGAIEQDADVIVMLYRDEYYNPNTPDRGIAEVIVTKNRNGPVGSAQLLFEPEFTRFRNIKPSRSDGFSGRTVDIRAKPNDEVA